MEKTTPGSILAKLLSGDKSVTGEDFEKSTVKYFADHGVNCMVTKFLQGPKEDQKAGKESDDNNKR